MLAQVATTLIVRYSSTPSRGNVRLLITPRIVRHYLNEDLLGEPTGQMGTATVYNYGNLLRLLAVKKLLVDNWSLLKIRDLLREMDITALENLIRGNRPGSTRSGTQPESTALPTRTADPIPRRPVSLFNPKPMSGTNLAPTPNPSPLTSDWVELAPGLELRVRRGFARPQSSLGRRRIRDRFDAVVFGDGREDRSE